MRRQARVAVAIAKFGEQCVEHARLFGQSAQHIQALHIARALPRGVDRCLAVKARQDAVLHVARTAQAFGSFVDHCRSAFADPVLTYGGHQACKMRLLWIVQLVQRLSHAQAQRQCRLAFQCQVGQHVLHQWLFAQHAPTDLAMGAMVRGLGQRLSHQSAGADHAIETSHGHHFDDGRHSTPLFTDHPRQGAAKLHFAGSIGAVAELVLQTLDIELIVRVVGAVAWQQEAAQALVGLGQRQEGIAHWCRAEPLVADQLVRLARARGSDRIGPGGVGPHIGAALLLGHGHAEGHSGFVPVAHVSRVVLARQYFGQPVFGQLRLQSQGRHRSEGHGQGAASACFCLAVQVGHRSARDMGAGTRFGPGQRRQSMLDRGAHQLVIGRMECHQVDAVTITVMTAELRLVGIGQKTRSHQWAAGQGTVGVDPRLGPAGTEAPGPLLQWLVEAVQVGAVERRRLVSDFVGFSELVQVHRGLPGSGHA
ncbi:Uncharacterised protein [Pseudomonas putida]|nr:Uncharacterised protein [Pseudomonas putida]